VAGIALSAPPNITTEQTQLGAGFESIAGRRVLAGPGMTAIIAALVTAALSFAILLGWTPIRPSNSTTIALIAVNVLFIVILAGLVIYEVTRVLRARRTRRAASRLHVRIIFLFSLIAAVPAIVVAIVASITLNQGLDRWFEERTRAIVSSSFDVAQAYVEESARNLQGTTMSLAFVLDEAATLYNLDKTGFANLLTQQTTARGLADATLLSSGGAIEQSANVDGDDRLPEFPSDALQSAVSSGAVLIPPGSSGYVGAIVKLQRIPDRYLYTVRAMDRAVLGSMKLMEDNAAEYRSLEANRTSTQIAFAVLYLGITMIVLLSAIWMGIAVADRLVRPIRYLVHAADAVADGDLSVSLPVRASDGDLGAFSNTFNNMIGQLATQREALVTASEMNDNRRRFTEAVLSGVSAGVIGVNPAGEVTIMNREASALVPLRASKSVGTALETAVPEIAAFYRDVARSNRRSASQAINIRRGGRERTYNVQITMEQSQDDTHSHVITLDDVTDLVDAQRSSAWADVARRIAHEIKNPLTPIQLSAERLRRRYGKMVESDREVFDRCTETIIRQVGDIGRMVDEFSSFARMPKPVLEAGDALAVAREAMFLIEVARADIQFSLQHDKADHSALIDQRMLGQAIGNLIKNATEAIDAKNEIAVSAADPEGGGKTEKTPGRVIVRLAKRADQVVLEVIDNGKGFPENDRQRLLEPYMTTRSKGTGLGLAIVKKIVEEHGGLLEMADAPADTGFATGAMVSILLPALVAGQVAGADADAAKGNAHPQNAGAEA
jgi:two-component system, NtrC family, nitrogen regulation sensor histidine kinase NtrY